MLHAGRRRAVRRRPAAGTANVTALALPGNADNPISTPSPVGFPASTIDIRFRGTIEESNPTSRVFVHKADELVRLSVTWNHILRLQWRNAAGFQQVNATVAHGITLGTVASIRAVLRSNGGTGSFIDFYRSTDWNPYTDTGTWTAIGTSVSSTQSPVFHTSGGGALHIGGRADVDTENLDSDLTYVSLRPFGGTEFAVFDPTTVNSTGVRTPATYTDPIGNIWSLTGTTWDWQRAGAPGTITNLQATTQSDTSVALAWTSATGATSHQYRVNGGSWVTTSAATTHTVTGLTAGTLYSFEVRGVNDAGAGSISNTATATTTGGTAVNVIQNGGFADDTGWSGFWYSGKAVTGGKAVFTNAPAYDGVQQTVPLASGKYYELTWTISARTSGNVYPYFTGGTGRNGTVRAADGTYTERMLANSGNTAFGFMMETGGTLSVDDISLVGPYDTATIGGA